MTRRFGLLIVCGGVLVLSACATKGFVEEQIRATETKLSATETRLEQLSSAQETASRETAERAREHRHAIDVADQQIKTIDRRVDEVGAVATAAKTDADTLATVVDTTEARLSQRLAGRNRYRMLETRSVYFDAGRAVIQPHDFEALEQIARALKDDPNAVSELQGFADPRGSDRDNDQLSRARVDAVVRHLVQRHGVELRQLHAASMGKASLAAGEKPTAEALANARRVDIRLLTPWSSWEDLQAEVDDPSMVAGAASPATAADEAPARERPDVARRERETPATLRTILNAISKEELGGRE
jgi:outer membrane protein OmpA-like peptidoglycan-associated protein